MTGRAARIDAFLADAGWNDAIREPLPGDASSRRYVRLRRRDATAILMDAPPGTGEDARPFLAIAAWLRGHGLSAPAIPAADVEAGLLLMEDLGPDLLAVHAAREPRAEPALYAAAARTLAAMQSHASPPGLDPYTEAMPELAATIVDWYAPGARDRRDAIREAMAEALSAMPAAAPVLVHRDYHAENLLWLPERDGPARIGLLDFQDAATGPAEYDLASLVDDPRRAVSSEARDAAVTDWLDATGADAEATAARLAVCSAQRSLRIAGRVFTRIALQSGRTGYLRYVPPAITALRRRLEHPALAGMRRVLDGALPEPDAAWRAAIEARAGTRAGQDRA